MRRRTAVTASVAAVLVGVSAAVAVPLAWGGSDVPAVTTYGGGAATRLAQQPQPSATPSAPKPVREPSAVTSVRPAARPAPTPPVRVSLPGLGIDVPVVPVGVDASGAMAIPEDVRTAGWYRWSEAPGSAAGSVVVVAHVDSAEQGEGAFFQLRTVAAGETVTVSTGTRSYRYRVIARQSYPKSSAPLAAVFATSGAPRLTLITCGGSFDAQTASYSDNVVVTAVPS